MINALVLAALLPLLRRLPYLILKAIQIPFHALFIRPVKLCCAAVLLCTDVWCQVLARCAGLVPKHYQAITTVERLRKTAQLQANELQELRDQLEEALATKSMILEKYRVAKTCYRQLVTEVKEMEAVTASASRSARFTKAARMAGMQHAESFDVPFSPGGTIPPMSHKAQARAPHLNNSHQSAPHTIMWSTHASMLAAAASWLYWWSLSTSGLDAAASGGAAAPARASPGISPAAAAAISINSPNVILAAYRTKIFTYTVLVAYVLWVLRIIPGGRVMGALLGASAWALVGWCAHAMAMSDVCGV